jgi:hypothetical protein
MKFGSRTGNGRRNELKLSRLNKLTLVLPLALLAGFGFAQEIKDPNPGTGGPNGIVRGPGPDGFGYVFDTSVPYVAVDISGTGALVVSGDDVGSGPLAVAPFNIYGTVVTALAMTSNGYISTDTADTGPDLSPDCPLPATPSTPGGTLGARLYPLHDDLITNTGYYEFFAVCPRASDRFGGLGCHVFQWKDATHFGGGGPFDITAFLYQDAWDMAFQVGPGNPETGSASTTGIQNGGATIGLTVACDVAGSIPDNFAVGIYHPFPEVCSISSITVQNFHVTITGDCPTPGGGDLYAEDLDGNITLVAAGLNIDPSTWLDVSGYPDSRFFIIAPGDVPSIANAVDGVISGRTVPTLGEWGLLIFLGLLAVAALYFMRRRSLTV